MEMSFRIPTNTVSVTHSSERSETTSPDLRLLHYNDVYHIEPGSAEPIGGISRFQAVVDHYRFFPKYAADPRLLTLFSGDAFNPSIESTVTKGQHMVPILNGIGTDVACVGNHDLDFGISQFQHLSKQCNFPWLLANVLDPNLGEDRSLADCPKTVIIRSSNGIKIGLIGLGEREWLETINSLPPNLQYLSASETAKQLVPGLRAAGAELVIALTHQRDPNDIKLAEKTPPGLIDLVLGGHDHHYTHEYVNGTHVLCSGSDFKQLSYIEARRKPNGQPGWDFDILRHDIGRSIEESEKAKALVGTLTTDLKKTLEEPVGYTAVPLDARFSTIRVNESNMGNFICDLMRFYYNADCAIMAAGTIRGDQVYPPGVIFLKDILDCFPFEDAVMVVRITGQGVQDALENGVSGLPAHEGRFPQISNLQFQYDPKRPSGKRVLWTKLNGEDLDLQRKYTVATRGYMARGKDGFTSLMPVSNGGVAEELVTEEEGVLLSTIIRQYFLSLKVMGQWSQWSHHMHSHWLGVHENMHTGGKVKKPGKSRESRAADYDVAVTSSADGHTFELRGSPVVERHGNAPHLLPYGIFGGGLRKEREAHLARKYLERWKRNINMDKGQSGLDAEHDHESQLPFWTHGIAPRIEGRILVAKQDGSGSSPSTIGGAEPFVTPVTA